MWHSVIVILVILLICRNCCKNYSYLFIYLFCIVSVFVVVVVVSYWSCKLVILVYFTISCIFCVVNKRLKKRGLGSTMKSSKNFVEDALHVARIQNPNSRVSGTAGSVMNIVILIQECSSLVAKKHSLTREDKIDQFKSLGYDDFKGLTRFSQSLFFSFSIKEKTKGGSALRLLEKLRTTQWKFRGNRRRNPQKT